MDKVYFTGTLTTKTPYFHSLPSNKRKTGEHSSFTPSNEMMTINGSPAMPATSLRSLFRHAMGNVVAQKTGTRFNRNGAMLMVIGGTVQKKKKDDGNDGGNIALDIKLRQELRAKHTIVNLLGAGTSINNSAVFVESALSVDHAVFTPQNFKESAFARGDSIMNGRAENIVDANAAESYLVEELSRVNKTDLLRERRSVKAAAEKGSERDKVRLQEIDQQIRDTGVGAQMPVTHRWVDAGQTAQHLMVGRKLTRPALGLLLAGFRYCVDHQARLGLRKNSGGGMILFSYTVVSRTVFPKHEEQLGSVKFDDGGTWEITGELATILDEFDASALDPLDFQHPG